jgi:TetR/AcrR family transcriptional regulator
MAAARPLFAERGVQRTTIDEIANAADLSVGTVYFHFQSKEGLYLALVDEALEINTKAMAAIDRNLPALDRVIAAGQAYLQFALEHPDHFRMVALRALDPRTDPDLADIEERVASRVEALVGMVERDLAEAIADGSVRSVPVRDAMRFLWGAWNGVAALGFRPDRLRLNANEVSDALQAGQQLIETALRVRQ